MRSLFAAQILLAALVFAQDDGTTTVDDGTTAPADDGTTTAADDGTATTTDDGSTAAPTAGGDTATEDAAADDAEQTFSAQCLDWILAFRDQLDDNLFFYDAAS